MTIYFYGNFKHFEWNAGTLTQVFEGNELKDINELLREKEEELAKLNQEIEAIRMVARLLSADGSEKNRPAPSQERTRELGTPPRMKDFP